MKKMIYLYLIYFGLMFLHSEIGLLKMESDFCHDHDICSVIEQSNMPASLQQISVNYIIDNYFISQIPDFNISFFQFNRRTDFIHNPLSEFLKDDLIHLFKNLQI
jgi:hypothetical protein